MNEGDSLQIDRVEVLKFFDDPDGRNRHTNAIAAVAGEELGVGLMKHYLEWVAGARVQVLPGSCTPGTKSGARLDRWILVQWPDRTTLFQVEIKNWAASSKGGKRLALEAPPDVVAAHKRERWSSIWDASEENLRVPETQKVLTPMKTVRGEAVEPVLCVWDAVHPDGDSSPWFSIALPVGSHFERLWVFSMSAFLRTLSDPYLRLDMPDTVRRLAWLQRLLPTLEITTDDNPSFPQG